MTPITAHEPYTIIRPSLNFYGAADHMWSQATFLDPRRYVTPPNVREASAETAQNVAADLGLEADSVGCTWQQAIAEVRASRLRAIDEEIELDFEPEA